MLGWQTVDPRGTWRQCKAQTLPACGTWVLDVAGNGHRDDVAGSRGGRVAVAESEAAAVVKEGTAGASGVVVRTQEVLLQVRCGQRYAR